jgi:hypothetical protein
MFVERGYDGFWREVLDHVMLSSVSIVR